MQLVDSKLAMVAQAYNPNTWEKKVGGCEVKVCFDYTVSPYFLKGWLTAEDRS